MHGRIHMSQKEWDVLESKGDAIYALEELYNRGMIIVVESQDGGWAEVKPDVIEGEVVGDVTIYRGGTPLGGEPKAAPPGTFGNLDG